MTEETLKSRLDTIGWNTFSLDDANQYVRDMFKWMEQATREIDRLQIQVEKLLAASDLFDQQEVGVDTE